MRTRFFLPLLFVPLLFLACGPESPTPMTAAEIKAERDAREAKEAKEAKSVDVAPVPDAAAPLVVEDPPENPNPVTASTVNQELGPLPEDPARGQFTLAQALDGL